MTEEDPDVLRLQNELRFMCYKRNEEEDEEAEEVFRCGRCEREMLPDDIIITISRTRIFHVLCFTCYECGRLIRSGDRFGFSENQPFCAGACLNRITKCGPNAEDKVPREGQVVKPKRQRNTLTPHQRQMLSEAFAKDPLPNRQVKEALSLETGVPMKTLQNWFQNKRSQEKKAKQRNEKQHNPLSLVPFSDDDDEPFFGFLT